MIAAADINPVVAWVAIGALAMLWWRLRALRFLLRNGVRLAVILLLVAIGLSVSGS